MVLSTSTTSTLSSTLSPGEGSLLGLDGIITHGLYIFAPPFVVILTSKSFTSFGVVSFKTFTLSTFPFGSVQEIVALNGPLPDAITFVEKVVVVELKMFDTKPEHAKEYGLDSVNPLYVQSLCITENQRLKGIGNKVLKYIDENYDDIEKDMNESLKNMYKKKDNDEKEKRRKRRQLSVSAIKTVNKNNTSIVVSFN
jgi:hypothetical protein